jgi:hypothetical protein
MVRNVPEWKYASYLASVPGCPPTGAQPRERNAFRFVWNPIDQSCFVPVALKLTGPPQRTNRQNQPSCSAFGLSMFTTEALARARFAKLEEINREIRKSVGTHLAGVALTMAHGVQTQEGHNGHFDLHEYEDIDLVSASTLVGPL